MKYPKVHYSQNFEILVALITYLAFIEGDDAVKPPEIARHIGFDENEVTQVLNNFKGIFRRSENMWPTTNYGTQYKYTLQIRYARRKYSQGKLINTSESLSNEDFFTLLEFITNKSRDEQENERQFSSNRITMIGVWTAAVMSLLTIIVTILK